MPRSLGEVKGFMDREPIASFATVDAQRKPHIVPVFFTFDGGKVYIQSGRDSVKVHNLLHNDNVAVAVYRGEEAVIVKGKGRLVDVEDEFVKRTQDHIDKYHLRLDDQGRDSLGIPLFNKRRCAASSK